MKSRILPLLTFFGISLFGRANVSLPSVFSDGMVLQRNSEVTFWGYANPSEEIVVTTSWDGAEYKTKGTATAHFSLTLKTGAAGGPYTIRIKGWNERVIQDVWLGEVWLCSGQSNMEMTPSWGLVDRDSEVAQANDPLIHIATITKKASRFPQEDVPVTWQSITPEVMKNSSSVAYFFAKRLREEMPDVPIGLIVSAWGGSPAEIWIPETTIASDDYLKQAAAALTDNQWSPHLPGDAYNAMIHPLVPYRIAGALWYQGESNTGAAHYETTLLALISSWRAAWGYTFPFYVVQIAPYKYENNEFGGGIVRNAQRKVLSMTEKVGMVAISDVSTIDDIHPQNKKPVGRRLAGLALADVYGIQKGENQGPLYEGWRADGRKAIVQFRHADGLHFTSKKTTLFEIAGADGVFHTAEARISGNQVILSCRDVTTPTHVRYALRSDAVSDLFNSAGLPASTFQTE